MKSITFWGRTKACKKVETFISIEFKNTHPMQDASRKNATIVANALFNAYHKESSIDYIDLQPFSNDGMKVLMKLDSLEGWDGEDATLDKHSLYHELKNILEVMGPPNSIVVSKDCYYARWIRNMVEWF